MARHLQSLYKKLNRTWHDAWRNDEGDMGIGTLLIFIAIVLSSAVASVLIIFATQQIVQQAQQTALDTSAKASKQLEIISMMGDRNVNGSDLGQLMSRVQVVYIDVRPVAGSPDIYLNSIMVDITDGYNRSYLNYNNVSGAEYANETHFTVKAIKDDDGSLEYGIASTQDVFSIIIKTGLYGGELDLLPQVRATLRIVVTDGFLTYEEILISPGSTRYVTLV